MDVNSFDKELQEKFNQFIAETPNLDPIRMKEELRKKYPDMVNFDERVAGKFKKIRERKGITIEDAAAGIEITKNHYAALERAAKGLDLFQFVKLCNFFKVDPMEIIRDELCEDIRPKNTEDDLK